MASSLPQGGLRGMGGGGNQPAASARPIAMTGPLPRLLPVLTVGLAALLAAGCGTQLAGGSAGAAATATVPALDEPVGSPGDLPAVDPSAPPTISLPPGANLPVSPVFENRAKQVADAWRSRGLVAAWRDSLIPLSGLTDVPAFSPNGELKAAYGNGWVEVAGTLPTATKPGASVSVGGSTIAVRLQPAAAALRDATPQRFGACPPAVTVGGCGDPVLITGAKLTTTTLATNRGVATVPAWSFTIKGNEGPLVQVAIDPADLDPAPGAGTQIPGADGDRTRGVVASQALISIGGSTVTYSVGVGACDSDITPRVYETDDLVVVGATIGQPTAEVCNDMLKIQPVQVTTRSAVGTRPVVDALTGAPVVLPALPR